MVTILLTLMLVTMVLGHVTFMDSGCLQWFWASSSCFCSLAAHIPASASSLRSVSLSPLCTGPRTPSACWLLCHRRAPLRPPPAFGWPAVGWAGWISRSCTHASPEEAEAAPAEAPSIDESHEFGTGNEIGAWNMRQSRADAALVACRTIGCPFSAHRYRDFAGWCCKSCGQTENAEERKNPLLCISSFGFNSEPYNGLLENWEEYSGRFHGCGCEGLRYNGPPRPAGPLAAAEAAPVHEIL